MMTLLRNISITLALILFVASSAFCEELTPEQKAKVETKMKALSAWSTDKKIVDFVVKANANPLPESKGMTQEKWAELNMLSPEVKAFSKNELATYLKTLKEEMITEIFVSCADGGKAAFLSKTTSWSHKGKPKHDVPMTGKSWIGKPEVDESTGLSQVQVSIPVMDNGSPVGSIVIGLDLSKL